MCFAAWEWEEWARTSLFRTLEVKVERIDRSSTSGLVVVFFSAYRIVLFMSISLLQRVVAGTGAWSQGGRRCIGTVASVAPGGDMVPVHTVRKAESNSVPSKAGGSLFFCGTSVRTPSSKSFSTCSAEGVAGRAARTMLRRRREGGRGMTSTMRPHALLVQSMWRRGGRRCIGTVASVAPGGDMVPVHTVRKAESNSVPSKAGGSLFFCGTSVRTPSSKSFSTCSAEGVAGRAARTMLRRRREGGRGMTSIMRPYTLLLSRFGRAYSTTSVGCWSCGVAVGEGSDLFFCDACDKIQDVRSRHPSAFEVFGLPVEFPLDVVMLEESWKGLQRRLHPDKFVSAGAREQEIASVQSTIVNDSYSALKHPVQRGKLVLKELHGLEPLGEDVGTGDIDMELLMHVMKFREEIDSMAPEDTDRARALDHKAQSEIDETCAAFAEEVTHGRLTEASDALVKMQYFCKIQEELREKCAENLF